MSDLPPSPAPDACLLYLLRHGATDNNVANPPRLQGRRANPGLSVAGRRQVEHTAGFLAARRIDAIYTSPLLRARETAAILAQPHDKPVEAVDALIEADLGDWEGRTWPEIERDEPEKFRQFEADPGTHGYGGGENFSQVCARVVPVLEQLVQTHLGQVVLVVAHNVVNRAVLAHSLGLPMAHARRITQTNCGVNILRYRQQRFQTLSINSVFHLYDW
jgi:phosphoserine phosphatase